MENLTDKQIRLIERARNLSGAGKVENPSSAVDTINELRGKSISKDEIHLSGAYDFVFEDSDIGEYIDYISNDLKENEG